MFFHLPSKPIHRRPAGVHMSSRKRWKFKNFLTAYNGGCGCGPKATDVIEPKLKSTDQKPSPYPSSSPTSSDRYGGGQRTADDDGCTSTTFSLNADNSPQLCPDHTKTVCPCPKIHDSLAVVKDSNDPYRDFRQSMLQMIFEKEIYSRDDLQQLLHCFLDLNSPHHHEIIVRAFMEIWNGGVAVGNGGEETTPPCSSTSGPG